MTEQSLSIPDDLATCQGQLRAALEQHAALLQRLHDLDRQLDETCATAEELQRAYACLKEEFLALKRLLFGPRRERLPEAPGQGHLFDDAAAASAIEEPADPQLDEASLPCRRRKGHGRRPIPDHLPREEVLHDVTPEERTCGCGREKARIGEDVSEQLEYIPGKLVVLRHVYPKYALCAARGYVEHLTFLPHPVA
jgi:transposase